MFRHVCKAAGSFTFAGQSPASRARRPAYLHASPDKEMQPWQKPLSKCHSISPWLRFSAWRSMKVGRASRPGGETLAGKCKRQSHVQTRLQGRRLVYIRRSESRLQGETPCLPSCFARQRDATMAETPVKMP